MLISHFTTHTSHYFVLLTSLFRAGGSEKGLKKYESSYHLPQTEEATWMCGEAFQHDKKEDQLLWLSFHKTNNVLLHPSMLSDFHVSLLVVSEVNVSWPHSVGNPFHSLSNYR